MKQEHKHANVTFKKLGHFWLDSGLVGLHKIACDIVSSDSSLDHAIPKIVGDTMVLRGSPAEIEDLLWRCSKRLMNNYYNCSSKRQREQMEAIVFNKAEQRFEKRYRRSPHGLSAVVFDAKAADLHGRITVWKKETIKDEEFSHFEDNLKDFLRRYELRLTYDAKGKASIPINEPFYYSPIQKKDIRLLKPKRAVNSCFICGEERGGNIQIKGPVFPMITGSSGVLSFNSLGGQPEKICWKCSLLGKFVPVNGFYLTQGEHLFAFLPYSPSLEKMAEVFGPLREAEYRDPNLLRNFDHPLGGYFQRPFEVTFAFLYTLYKKLLLQKRSGHDDENVVLDWEEMLQLTTSKAPLEFFVLHFVSKGQTTMCKMAWPYRDSVYFFRLMEHIEGHGINVQELMRLLVDFTQQKNENKTLIRNRICERILKKQSVLHLAEAHVFRAKSYYFKPLLDFLTVFESIVRGKEGAMTEEEQKTAVTLGKRLGMVVGEAGKKGDLFAVRKSRTKTDFLEQLNRLQFKLGSGFTVPPPVYEGKLTDGNFVEFKQFCMIAAVNSYNAVTSKGSWEGGKS